MSKRLHISGGRLFDPAKGLDERADLLLEDGRIIGVGAAADFDGVRDAERIDVSGLLVCPGLVDIHVHLREPGQEWKETILTGSQAAVAGGFTRICCMPNTLPVNDSASVTEFMLRQAARAGLCRVDPIGAITMGSEGKSLSPMMELVEAGCVAFSDDGAPVYDAQIMRRALEYNLMLGTVLTVHEEDLRLSDHFAMNESAMSVRLGLKGMPDASENVMIARDIELARLTGGRVHFCHVSTARGVTLIRRAKEDGIPVTAEVTPQHITLTEEAISDYDTNAKMSMPLRKEEDLQALIEGLADGVIDCIATDHAPHEADSKNVEFDRASFGILGLQTSLPLTMRKVRDGSLTLERAIESLSSAGPRCLGIPENSLSQGATADITIIDIERTYTLERELNRSKSSNTPFWGEEMSGLAMYTIVDGKVVYDAEKEFPDLFAK
jgi:dihydroorotase